VALVNARVPATPRVAAALAVVLFAVAPQAAKADAGWFESGDTALRLDLQLLNDAGVIRYPVNQWPIPRTAVQYALANERSYAAKNAAVLAAIERVRARLEAPVAGRIGFHSSLRVGQAGLTRDFDALAREEGEVSAGADYFSGQFALGLNATVVTDAGDGQDLRPDGSHATVQIGNWLLSAHTLDRWWGPGHEGSLILSNNARPMPTVMLERATARPFESRWLSWLGPWRFSLGFSRMEDERQDIDAPLFMAWRVVVMPFKDIELGISRTAQFCGKQLECNWDVFGNLLAGNDNVGIDASPEDEPGNQMAGFDIHWASPIGTGPYALYAQYIGEDESSYLPVKYLGLLGIEAWKPRANGDILQVFGEYANTTCSALSARGGVYDCAYNQGKFNAEGYRYRGRVIGFTTDGDSESVAIGVTYSSVGGAVWSGTARTARLNHDGFDARNTVSAGPQDYAALEAGWRRRLFGQSISVNLGAEYHSPLGGDRKIEPFGFISWHHEFKP
jgi:hypothetical protein